MDNYSEFEKKVKENNVRNEKFISEFDEWLSSKGFSSKIIRKHLGNASLYIDNYLNYYDAYSMEDGLSRVSIDEFLDDWFIRKCAFSSENSLKEMGASKKNLSNV